VTSDWVHGDMTGIAQFRLAHMRELLGPGPIINSYLDMAYGAYAPQWSDRFTGIATAIGSAQGFLDATPERDWYDGRAVAEREKSCLALLHLRRSLRAKLVQRRGRRTPPGAAQRHPNKSPGCKTRRHRRSDHLAVAS